MNSNITFYKCTDEKNVLNKNLTSAKTLTGVVDVNTISILKPIIKLDTDVSAYQICYIEALGRYYFIDSIILENSVFGISASVDVLTTYKTDILGHSAIISTDSKGNPDIESNVPLKAKKRVQTKKFANSFSNTLSNYVLTVIG